MGIGTDIGIITNNEVLLKQLQAFCQEMCYSFKVWQSLETFMETPSECAVTIAALETSDTQASEFAQSIKYISNNSFVLCTVAERLDKEVAVFAKKSGANLILLNEEITTTSKLQFVCSQVIGVNFIPIKSTDLAPGTEITFRLFHLMPTRSKFIAFGYPGYLISPEKIAKIAETGEIYLKREDAFAFNEYIKANQSRIPDGIAKVCRSEFMALFASYVNLVFSLTDRSEFGSYVTGKELYQKCEKFAGEIAALFDATVNIQDIVNTSIIGEFGSVERGPAIACYAAILAKEIPTLKSLDALMASLLADIGILMLPPESTKKLRTGGLKSLSATEMEAFKRTPAQSVSLLLDRKLPITPSLRTVLSSTYEQFDGKGFPEQLVGNKIPEASMVASLARELDSAMRVRMGSERVRVREAFLKMMITYAKDTEKYSPIFLKKVIKTFG